MGSRVDNWMEMSSEQNHMCLRINLMVQAVFQISKKNSKIP